MVIFFVSYLVLFEEKLAWVSFVADYFTLTILSCIEMPEKRRKKERNIGSVPMTCVCVMASVRPVPSAIRLQGLFGPRVSFYWGYWGLEEWSSLSKARHLPWRRPRPSGPSDGKPRAQLQRPLSYEAPWLLGTSPSSGLSEIDQMQDVLSFQVILCW